MPGLVPDVDPDGLLEYSVVYTDRALNHMSANFQQVMRDISATLKTVYGAAGVAIVPGSGTFAMEAVARQLATGRRCLIIRNGWFSYRWTQILEMGNIADASTVLMAQAQDDSPTPSFAPPALDRVIEAIDRERPQVVFAPHVETSSGMILPDAYLAAVADATHAVGGLFVLDCIASGAIWVDMSATGVDVLISAPQKGWSGPPCAGLVMMNGSALAAIAGTTSTSFACDLRKWYEIMQAYETGGHAYHATMPTDSLRTFRAVMAETEAMGFETARQRQQELGDRVRALLADAGFASVAAPGYEAPGVVVSYTDDESIHTGSAFASRGLQIAKGVPLKIGEPESFQTFRLGLFGLDKLSDVDAAVDRLAKPLAKLR